MADIFPPDFTSTRGMVRAMIPDVEQVDFSGEGVPEYIFSDPHLDALLASSRGGDLGKIKRAAAKAMRAIGNSEGLVQKVIRTEDLQTDGAKLQQAFRAAARDLEEEANGDDEEEEDIHGFAIVDFQPYPLDCLPYSIRGFPRLCCIGARIGACECGTTNPTSE